MAMTCKDASTLGIEMTMTCRDAPTLNIEMAMTCTRSVNTKH